MDALSVISSIISLVLGALLGQLVSYWAENLKKKKIKKRNTDSLAQIPQYDPLDNEIVVVRRWNSIDRLDDGKTKIIFDEERVYDSITPSIDCPYISMPDEWKRIYAEELQKEKKRTGIVSYVTAISLDHKDTKRGNSLELKVSSCDYLAHHVNSKYFAKYPEDWKKIKEVIQKGDFDEYFLQAMPGNVFVNFIVINGQTNRVLAIKRSSQELNARNIWGLSGFETMNDVANLAHGSEELKLEGIVYRGLLEELTLKKNEISQVEISSLSFVKHLGFMVTALVRIDLQSSEDNSNALTEGKLIERILSRCESGYEHVGFKWLPIQLKDMKEYIERGTGYYQDVIQLSNNKEERWIGYAKLQMYEIWRNRECIDLVL